MLHAVPFAAHINITHDLFSVDAADAGDELHGLVASSTCDMAARIDLPLDGPSCKHPPMLWWALRLQADPRLAHVTSVI